MAFQQLSRTPSIVRTKEGGLLLNEERVAEALLEFLNAVDAGIAAAKQRIKEAKALLDPSKVKWEEAEGSKGLYERSEDTNNLEFKAMLKNMQAHGGKMSRDGYFYWAFEKASVVGRKPLKKN